MTKKSTPIAFLTAVHEFPPVKNANSEGLLAVGGDLDPDRLILAYKSGIFPWFNEDSLILWWSPDPRMVLFPDRIKISKSMRKVMRESTYRISKNEAFELVMQECASVARKNQEGTWITRDMKTAYSELHRRGFVHSYEVWEGSKLVGGLYGIDLGHVFCGESMFTKATNASKLALVQLADDLCKKNYQLIDCQLYTRHLESLGAVEIPREEFIEILKREHH